MKMKTKWIGSMLVLALFAVMAGGQSVAASQPKKGPVKVFILAGQSNMEGHAASSTLDYLGEDPKYGPLLGKIKKPDGTWVVRDDVWIEYLGRKGNLELGYGVGDGKPSAGDPALPWTANSRKFGPELAFGIDLGDYFENQVLLIKTCWGGHSLYGNFRPPSSGGQMGASYSNMVAITRNVLKNLKTLFPDYDEAKGCEIAGFLWFQGFNDQFDPKVVAEYEQNLVNLIKDLRKEFKVPNLPVVIGALGTGGQKGPIAQAQEAAAKRPEFKDTVRFVETAPFWDKEAEKLLPLWNTPEKAKFYRIASERPYHYLGSGKMMFLMGNAMGEAMVELLKK